VEQQRLARTASWTVTRLLNRCLTAALWRWTECAAEARRQSRVMTRALERLRSGVLEMALAAWREGVDASAQVAAERSSVFMLVYEIDRNTTAQKEHFYKPMNSLRVHRKMASIRSENPGWQSTPARGWVPPCALPAPSR
jgi:hypothetical protein